MMEVQRPTPVLVAALNDDFSPRRLERYLAATHQSGARPLVVLTKTDNISETKLREATDAVRSVTGP